MEIGFRPTKDQALRFAEAFSVAFWLVVMALGTYAQFWLPYWIGGSPRPSGCYFTNAMIIFVECRESGADAFFAALLTYSWMWSWGIWMTLAILPLVIWLPWTWLAIAALFFVSRLIVRQLPRFSE